ncbi:MAG: sulfatase-like hydrolase/transferase [Candidatus Coatesbacteria bacterium]|nr:sulfatase-like hydrolase/transferase [Candidatus Coatesbacteria bacterium]
MVNIVSTKGFTYINLDFNQLSIGVFHEKASLVLLLQIFFLLVYFIISFLILHLADKSKKMLSPVFRKNSKSNYVGIFCALCFFFFLLMHSMSTYPALFTEILRKFLISNLMIKIATSIFPIIWLLPVFLIIIVLIVPLLKYLISKKYLPELIIILIMFMFYNKIEKLHSPNDSNLLFIVSDSLRGDYINGENCPFINKLKERGIFIKNLRISIARTEPSWASILTGKHVQKHGIRHMFTDKKQHKKLKDNLLMDLAEKGYITSVFGDFCTENFKKTDFGINVLDTPKLNYTNMLYLLNLKMHPSIISLLTLPFLETFDSPLSLEPNYMNVNNITHKFKSFLDNNSKPFASIIHYPTTHFPYAVPYPYYKNKKNPLRNKYAKEDNLYDTRKPSENDIEQIRFLYSSGVRLFDKQVEDVFRDLKSRNILENTYIIIMGDHGDNLYDDMESFGHGDELFGVSNLTPCIITGKNISKMEFKSDEIIRDIDLRATVSSLMNIQQKSDGLSFCDTMIYQSNSSKREMYYETGIWFTDKDNTSWQRSRIKYPEIMDICKIDEKGEFVIKEEYSDLVISSKQRAYEDESGKIVYMPNLFSTKWAFFRKGSHVNEIDNTLYVGEIENLKAKLKNFIEMYGEEFINERFFYDPGINIDKSVVYNLFFINNLTDIANIYYKGNILASHPVLVMDYKTIIKTQKWDFSFEVPVNNVRKVSLYGIKGIKDISFEVYCNGEKTDVNDLFAGPQYIRPFKSMNNINLEEKTKYLYCTKPARINSKISLYINCISLNNFLNSYIAENILFN